MALARSGDTYRVLVEGDLFDQAAPERASEEREELRARQRSANLTREERNEVRRTQIMEHLGKAADIVKQLGEEAPDHPAK
ncbi:hypothetical protein [Actinomadura sp. 21ATH]|uniref:hypothetical protein n=1 Tax=Actinomadura sp. 21ATH TaxID=1735444 RepID=UPI0035C1764D